MNLLRCALALACLPALDAWAHGDVAPAPTANVLSAAAAAGSCMDGICLALTVTTDPPPACGSTTNLTVAIGTPVNFCYTVTNESGIPLGYHSLGDNVDAQVFWLLEQPLAPGASYQYNRVVSIRDNKNIQATWTAQDAQPGYMRTTTSGGFIDVAAIGTPLHIGNEAIVGVELPFAFGFYGHASTHLCVSSDGFAVFDLSPCPTYSYYASQTLPTAYMLGSAFMPLWEELVVGSGEVYAATLGTAPNRRFVIEWYDRPPYAATDGFTFELILDESSGLVSFEYQDLSTDPVEWGDGALATIGLQASGSLADQFSYFSASVTGGMGIEWTPTSPQSFSANASASVVAGGPVMSIAPTAVRRTIPSSSSTSTPLTIVNAGTAPLSWSLSETPTQARSLPASGENGPIPVFAEDLSGGRFVNFDASDPAALTPVADTDYELTGGDFVDNDPTRLYAIDGSSAAHRNTLVVVDTTTGATTEIGPAVPLGAATWTTLKWDHATRTLFAVAADCTYTNSTLYTIDRGSGTPTRVGPISTGGHNCIMSIAIDSMGRMFGIDLISNEDALVAIDKSNGSAHTIGMLGVPATGDQGMDFDDASGVLYWARYAETEPGQHVSEIRTINTTTGAATLVGPIGTGAPQIDAFSIGAAGDCASADDIPWLSLSPTSGTTAAGGTSEATLTLDASALAAGVYDATVCVIGNDSDTPIERLPVELVVIDANDVIFRNGLDGG